MYVALLGSALCLAMMFIIQWWAALITFACVAALYLYVHYKKPGQWLDCCNINGEGASLAAVEAFSFGTHPFTKVVFDDQVL